MLHILQSSSSAALTAVVASVATAFPHASGETLLVLLRSPLCILLDRHRLASESHVHSEMFGLMSRFDAENQVYVEERRDANARPHRHHDLETAITNLQLGPLAPRVHEILDRHREEMKAVEEQEKDDRLWRLAMHRMDLRQYTVAEDEAEAPVIPEFETTSDDGRQLVRLDLKEPEPDVKEMMDQSAAHLQSVNAKLGLLMWGLKAFNRDEPMRYDPALWREKLREARTPSMLDGDSQGHNLHGGGPGFVAVICVRDHWDEMSGDEREWCVDVVCSEIQRQGDHWNQSARIQRFDAYPDRPFAWVVPPLIGKPLSEVRRTRVCQMLVVALTHPIDEVRQCAASGIGGNLWEIDRELTLRCINALASEATMVQQLVDAESIRPFHGRRHVDEIEAEVAFTIRQRFRESDGISDEAHQTFDPTRWFGAEANGRILAILGDVPTDAAAIAGFARLARTLVGWWDADSSRRRWQHEREPERNNKTEVMLTDLLQNFLLRTTTVDATTIVKPIVDAIDLHPNKVHWILLGLIGIEDRQPNTTQFWLLWDLFADRVRNAAWLAEIDDEHASGGEMMSAIFLGSWWKEDARHWRSLEGHAGHIHALFEDLPPSSTVLDDYLRFLYHVGDQSLPDAFIRIAKRLQQGAPHQMMRKGNTVFLLEVLLQRHVYGRPLELKRHCDLREAVIFLLDRLVENGSSAAFRMRDDFVTPLPVA